MGNAQGLLHAMLSYKIFLWTHIAPLVLLGEHTEVEWKPIGTWKNLRE